MQKLTNISHSYYNFPYKEWEMLNAIDVLTFRFIFLVDYIFR